MKRIFTLFCFLLTNVGIVSAQSSVISSPRIIQSDSASRTPLTIRAASGQTANIFQIQNNAGSNLCSIDSAGALSCASIVLTSPVPVADGGTGATSLGTSLTNSGNVLNTIQGVRITDSPTFGGLDIGTATFTQVGGYTQFQIGPSSGGANTGGLISLWSNGAARGYLYTDGAVANVRLQSSSGNSIVFETSGGNPALTLNTDQTATFVSTITGVSVTAGVSSTVTLATANVQFRGNSVLKDGTPTCSGGGCAIVSGSINSSGKVTTTTTGAVDITISFSANFANAPTCVANNQTTVGNILQVTTAAVGSFHLQGVTVNGNTLGWLCLGN